MSSSTEVIFHTCNKQIVTLSVRVGLGGVEECTLRQNSAQFQLKLPTEAELGNNDDGMEYIYAQSEDLY